MAYDPNMQPTYPPPPMAAAGAYPYAGDYASYAPAYATTAQTGSPYPYYSQPVPGPMFLPLAPIGNRRRRWVPWAIGAAAVALVVALVTAISMTGSSAASGPTLRPPIPDTATGGYVYTSKAGHFQARFLSKPREVSIPVSIGGYSATLHEVGCADPTTEVAEATSSQAIPAEQQQAGLQVELNSLAAGASLTTVAQTETTFRGLPARTATFTTADGQELTAITFDYSAKRNYTLLAQTGTAMDEIVASFVATP